MPNPYEPSQVEGKILPVRIRASIWTATGGVLGCILGAALSPWEPAARLLEGALWESTVALPFILGLLGMLAGFTAARWFQGFNALQRAAQIHEEAEQELFLAKTQKPRTTNQEPRTKNQEKQLPATLAHLHEPTPRGARKEDDG